MKNKGFILPLALLFTAGAAFASQRSTKETEQTREQKTSDASGTYKSKSHVVTGIVKDFKPGESLSVNTANDKTRKFDLDDKEVMTTIDSNVTIGSQVKVVESTDENGKKMLTVTLEKK
jgi:hypothetical protein